jgi:hypothetical protein
MFSAKTMSILGALTVVVFAFTYVLPKVLLNFNTISAFYIYSVDSDEAMKRWSDEARQWSIKRFIASVLKYR